ncbi:MAG: asparagine synthase-related protein, partial [Sphingomonas sp.]
MVFGDADDPKWSVSVDRGQTLALIGAAFDRESLSEEGAESASPDRLAGLDDRALLQSAWGSFVAIRRRIGPPYVTILRDPSGALPTLVADGAGFAVAAPDLPRWLRDALGIDPAIDMTKLALALANPLLPTHQALLAGVHQLPAGCALDWDGDKMGKARMLWAEPVALRDPVPDDPGAPGRMRRAVAGCVRALASPHRRLTLELSGGLDSAIVLGALASAPDPVEVSCVNFAVGHAGGDERSEARAVADRWKVRLVEVGAEAQDLCFGDLFAGEQPVEPILYGLDPILERASIGVARAFDTTAIFTGQGGDAVFCNLPTPLVAVDYARAAGWRALVSRIAYDAARRAHCSIWQVQRLMLRDRLASTRSAPQQLPGMQLGDATQRYGDAA